MDLPARLDYLIARRILLQVVGSLPEQPRVGLMCWAARPEPKQVNARLARLARWLNACRPDGVVVWIEDVLPRSMYGRDETTQMAVSRRYLEFFQAQGLADCRLASEIYQSGPVTLLDLLELLRRITFKEFLGLLPLEKRTAFLDGSQDLEASEIFHAGLHLLLLEELAHSADCWLTPMHSFAVAMAHRRLSPAPAAVLFTARLEDADLAGLP